ncbi:hypothetical protein ACFQ1M_14750 [Sungkyunkwania multivorans]|uniref:Uncharacterized protein n=1 Tax=Sungkyunkwania multivorans TaxID=1173618 RepID=A0ABW3D1Z2_9FLAO
MKAKILTMVMALSLGITTMSFQKFETKDGQNLEIAKVNQLQEQNSNSSTFKSAANTWVVIWVVIEVLGNHEARAVDVEKDIEKEIEANMQKLG